MKISLLSVVSQLPELLDQRDNLVSLYKAPLAFEAHGIVIWYFDIIGKKSAIGTEVFIIGIWGLEKLQTDFNLFRQGDGREMAGKCHTLRVIFSLKFIFIYCKVKNLDGILIIL